MFPINPLDDIIEQLGGPDKVAEMTGRGFRIVRRPALRRGTTQLVHEKRFKAVKGGGQDDSINITERKRFQDGRKLVAIISDAASTGISLHAEKRVKNQRRRLHITLELPWSADKAVQQLGRSHRSNQSSSPVFKLLITTIGAEWRFASAVASRLEQLGALTQGDRNASTGAADMKDFAVDTKWGADALNKMLDNLKAAVQGHGQGFPVASEFIKEDYHDDYEEFATEALPALKEVGVMDAKSKVKVNTFLNRLFGVQLALQANIFQHFLDTVDRVVAVAKQNNKYSEGIVDVSGESLKVTEKEILHTDKMSGAHVELVTVELDRGIPWEEALNRYQKAKEQGRNVMFLRSKNVPFGYPHSSEKRQVCLVIARAGDRKTKMGRSMFYGQHKPAAGISPTDIHRENLRDKNIVVQIFKPKEKPEGGGEVEVKDGDMVIKDPAEEDETVVLERTPLFEKYKKEWTAEYENHYDKCAHYSCHLKNSTKECDYGRRKKNKYVVTGSIIPIWGALTKHIKGNDMKIARISTDDGERIVGLMFAKQEQIAGVKKAIADLQKDKVAAPVTDDNPISLESFAKPRKSRPKTSGGAIRRRRPSGGGSSKSSSDGQAKKSRPSGEAAARASAGPEAPPSDDDMTEDDSASAAEEDGDESTDDDMYGDLDDCEMWEEVELKDDAAFTEETTRIGKMSQGSQGSQGPQAAAAPGADSSSEEDEDEDEDMEEGEEENGAKAAQPAKGGSGLLDIWQAVVDAKEGRGRRARVLSTAFMAPVSPEDYPDYHETISDPICLEDIREKLDTDPSYSLIKLQVDMKLLKDNAESYNEQGSEVYEDAGKLFSVFLEASTSLAPTGRMTRASAGAAARAGAAAAAPAGDSSSPAVQLHWKGDDEADADPEYEVEAVRNCPRFSCRPTSIDHRCRADP